MRAVHGDLLHAVAAAELHHSRSREEHGRLADDMLQQDETGAAGAGGYYFSEHYFGTWDASSVHSLDGWLTNRG